MAARARRLLIGARLVLAGGAVLVLAGGGCLQSTIERGAFCDTDDDCEGNEVCGDGFCYGDPPQVLQFAAVLQPPGDTSNAGEGPVLVPTEIPLLLMSSEGQLLNIEFERHVTITGSIEIPCEPEIDPTRMCGAIHATIEARRPSRIPGVPRFFRTFDTRIGEDGTPVYELNLPPSLCSTSVAEDCNDAYRLTVTPRSGTAATVLPDGEFTPVEQLVPPQRFDLIAAKDEIDRVFEVGDPLELKVLTGRIATAEGEPGYEVRALGRLTPLSELIQASTVAVTNSEGEFEMRVRNVGFNSTFDFVYQPGDTVTRPLPTVQVHNQLVQTLKSPGTESLTEVLLPSTPNSVQFTVPIAAASTAGDTVPVGGANVVFSTRFDTSNSLLDMTVTFSTQVTSHATEEEGTIGEATAQLFANRTYDVVVLPPADSEFAAKFDASVQTGSANGTTSAISLERRNAVLGVVINSNGNPVANAPVTAQASPRFMFELPRDPDSTIDVHEIIRELTFSVVTEDDGHFFMWLDGDLADQDASYSITVEPPLLADAPRWTFDEVGAPAESTDLGNLLLPRAAYAQGFILDPDGNPVPNAKLEIYELTSAEFCDNLCTPAPILRGTFVAGADGLVRPVVLPDPGNDALRR